MKLGNSVVKDFVYPGLGQRCIEYITSLFAFASLPLLCLFVHPFVVPMICMTLKVDSHATSSVSISAFIND
jgi:hypothetical protein